MTTQATTSTTNPFRLLRSYLFWTYDRGSIHYDVMVTLILVFLFVGPRFIDFGDKPVANVPLRSTEVLVKEAGTVKIPEALIPYMNGDTVITPQPIRR